MRVCLGLGVSSFRMRLIRGGYTCSLLYFANPNSRALIAAAVREDTPSLPKT
jgi:hypothetical protein